MFGTLGDIKVTPGVKRNKSSDDFAMFQWHLLLSPEGLHVGPLCGVSPVLTWPVFPASVSGFSLMML